MRGAGWRRARPCAPLGAMSSSSSSSSSSRRALDAPTGDLVVLSRTLVESVTEASRTNPRRRILLPFHKSEAELLHRMLNVIQPDSYVRPHRHQEPPKTEAWVVLRGALAFFTFEEDGRVRDCLALEAGGEAFGVDLAPGIFHGLLVLAPDTVIYEVKTGPYAPVDDKAFPSWAPAEGSPEVASYLVRLREEFLLRFPERAGGPAVRP
jgi:cupin fold WbuC family metalloprotein